MNYGGVYYGNGKSCIKDICSSMVFSANNVCCALPIYTILCESNNKVEWEKLEECKMQSCKKTLIGIVVKPLLNKQLKSTLWQRLVINDEIRQLVVSSGGIPIGIMPKTFAGNANISNVIETINNEEKEFLFASLDMLDGIILQGGFTSDTYEVEIVKYAINKNKPIIGICAGFNNIARAMDIPVIKKNELSGIHNVYDSAYRHEININKNHSLYSLFNTEIAHVNSLHCMFVENNNLPTSIEVLATSPDGNVEAFTVKNTKFCMAIKWHPELMMDSQGTINIFEYFIEMCK